jgi:hypothetical protein
MEVVSPEEWSYARSGEFGGVIPEEDFCGCPGDYHSEARDSRASAYDETAYVSLRAIPTQLKCSSVGRSLTTGSYAHRNANPSPIKRNPSSTALEHGGETHDAV